MIPLFFDEISKFNKHKINISELKSGQMYQIELKSGKQRYCRFYEKIGNILYFVKHFTIHGKLKGFDVPIQTIETIFEIDFRFNYMFDGKQIIKDFNKISLSLYEIE
jgi:hypothetical protein